MPTTMSHRVRTWTPRLLFLLASLLLLAQFTRAFAVFFTENQFALQYPYGLDYGEGVVLDQTLRLSRGENIYRNTLVDPPYYVSNYPLVFALVQAPLALLFGPSFWYGRFISILSIIAAALFIGLIVHAITADRLAGALAGVTLIAIPCIVYWSGLNRIDSLALALSCAGLYTVVRGGHRLSGLFIGGLLFTASIYTRQSYIVAAPFAAFVWLWRDQTRGRAFLLAALTLAMSGSVFVILNLATGGGFLLNIVSANIGPFDWSSAIPMLAQLIQYSPLLIVGAAIACPGFVILGIIKRNRAWWLATPYLIGALIVALTIGKKGSNINYLYELAVALCLVTGMLIAWQRAHLWRRALVLMLLAIQVGIMVNWHSEHYGRIGGVTSRLPEISKLAQIVQSKPAPVLADEDIDLVVLTRGALYYDPFARKQLAEAGLWNPAPFVDAILRKEFPVILVHKNLREERWTSEMLSAIYASYRIDQTLAGADVYVPIP